MLYDAKIPSTSSAASEINFSLASGILISFNENDRPPRKARPYPIDLISSKNLAVAGTSVFFKTSAIIPRSAFLVNTVLINETCSGTAWLNNTRPTVVSMNSIFIDPSSCSTRPLILICACKSTAPSFKAISTSSGE